MDKTKKYYWLKFHKDFFKRSDIRLIESMENGKEILLFYIKLLAESVDREGYLRINGEKPFDPVSLSIVTGTDERIVKSALKVFTDYRLTEVLEDGTIFMKEISAMTGGENDEHARELNRIRQANFRKRHAADVTSLEHNALRNAPVTQISNAEIEKEKKKESDKEPDKESKTDSKNMFLKMLRETHEQN